MVIEQDHEVIDKTNVCEKKLVEESDIVKSRYSPLCRQVGVCEFLKIKLCEMFALFIYLFLLCMEFRPYILDCCWNWHYSNNNFCWHGNRLFSNIIARTSTARQPNSR